MHSADNNGVGLKEEASGAKRTWGCWTPAPDVRVGKKEKWQ